MRIVTAAVGIVLMVLGAGFLWLGFSLAMDPSPDSNPNVLLIAGAMFGLVGLVLLAAGVGLMVATLEFVLPRRLTLVPGFLGLLPYPAFMGAPAVVLNLLLLAVAALLLWSQRFGEPVQHRGPSDASSLE